MSPSWGDWVCVVPLVINLLSLAASVLLFTRVSSLSGRNAQKVLARQIWHLALADVIDATLSIPWFLLDCLSAFTDIGDRRSQALDVLCKIGIWSNAPFVTSVLVEAHIALACFFAMWRFIAAKRVLSRMLPLLWVVGLCLGGEIAFQSDVSWHSGSHGTGTCNTGSRDGIYTKAITSMISLVICVAAYLATYVFSARRAGASVAARTARQTRIFLGAAVVSGGPLITYTIICLVNGNDEFPEGKDTIGYRWTYALVRSNGLVNACVWARSSRFRRQGRLARRSDGPDAPAADGCHSVGSHSVAFSWQPDVFIVPGMTRAANLNAEAEMLQEKQSDLDSDDAEEEHSDLRLAEQ